MKLITLAVVMLLTAAPITAQETPDAAETARRLRLEVDPESYWLYTSSPRDAQARAEAVERHGLEKALEYLSNQRR